MNSHLAQMSDSDSELTREESKSQPQKKRPCSVTSATSASHQAHAGSGHLVRTPSPPQALVKDAYTSPDRLRLREALMSGGEMGFKVVQKCKRFVTVDRHASVCINDSYPVN
jgi:hypothetical protein